MKCTKHTKDVVGSSCSCELKGVGVKEVNDPVETQANRSAEQSCTRAFSEQERLQVAPSAINIAVLWQGWGQLELANGATWRHMVVGDVRSLNDDLRVAKGCPGLVHGRELALAMVVGKRHRFFRQGKLPNCSWQASASTSNTPSITHPPTQRDKEKRSWTDGIRSTCGVYSPYRHSHYSSTNHYSLWNGQSSSKDVQRPRVSEGCQQIAIFQLSHASLKSV